MEQEFEDGVLQQTRVHFLGGRGIEAVVAIDHTQGNSATLRWLLYDGHGNLVRTMAPDYTLSDWQFRGVWGEVRGSLQLGRGYCANLGHPEDETGLVYMRARYYEPATGRFISEDPAGDGMNWYLYAEGNPVGKVDADGRFTFGDLLFGGLDQDMEYYIQAKNAQLAARYGQNAIERALYNYAKRYEKVADVLFGDEITISRYTAERLQITGIHGRFGIGIDFRGAEPVIKFYHEGVHISQWGIPWQVPFSALL